jgi:hypothetical protein
MQFFPVEFTIPESLKPIHKSEVGLPNLQLIAATARNPLWHHATVLLCPRVATQMTQMQLELPPKPPCRDSLRKLVAAPDLKCPHGPSLAHRLPSALTTSAYRPHPRPRPRPCPVKHTSTRARVGPLGLDPARPRPATMCLQQLAHSLHPPSTTAPRASHSIGMHTISSAVLARRGLRQKFGEKP